MKRLKGIKNNITDLLNKLTQYKKEFLDKNTVEGIKTRKEYLEILLEEYKNQGKKIEAPEVDDIDIEADIRYFRKRFSPDVSIASGINLDKPVVSARSEDFKGSINEIMGSVPVESFFIHLGDLKSRTEKIEDDGRRLGEEYYSLEESIKKDIGNISKVKPILEEFEENIKEKEDKDQDKKEELNADQLEKNIKDAIGSNCELYDSIEEIFKIYNLKKVSEEMDLEENLEVAKKSTFTKETREAFIKDIKGGDIGNLVKILKEFLSNRLEDDKNSKLFVSSCSYNPEIWKDYKEKLDKVEKIVEKGCNIPIVLTMLVRQDTIDHELGQDISQDMRKRIKEHVGGGEELLSLLDVPRQLKELSKKENIFLREIAKLRVDKIRDKVIELSMKNIKEDKRIPLYSLDYENKKDILDTIKDDKELHKKIIDKNASIVDAFFFENLYDDEEGRRVQDKIKKSRFMSFFKHFVDKEGPLIVLAGIDFKDHIKDSKIFEEMKESGKEIHFIKTTKPEKVIKNIKNIL